jgi:excisionase family DNA binding protein
MAARTREARRYPSCSARWRRPARLRNRRPDGLRFSPSDLGGRAPGACGALALEPKTRFITLIPSTRPGDGPVGREMAHSRTEGARGRGSAVTISAKARRPEPQRLALTLEEAAATIGVSRDSFDRHIKSELRLVRRGRLVLVPVTELERWLERSAALTLESDVTG